MIRCLTEEAAQQSNMKRCSTSLIIREMQINPGIVYPLDLQKILPEPYTYKAMEHWEF